MISKIILKKLPDDEFSLTLKKQLLINNDIKEPKYILGYTLMIVGCIAIGIRLITHPCDSIKEFCISYFSQGLSLLVYIFLPIIILTELLYVLRKILRSLKLAYIEHKLKIIKAGTNNDVS